MKDERKVVFISYAQGDIDLEEWVRKLADKLVKENGIDVRLDQYYLRLGASLPMFMLKSIQEADKVLVIGTPSYKEKADSGKGGVSFEHTLITQELYDSQSSLKFIPILREGSKLESFPGYLTSRMYFPMKDDDTFETDVRELVLEIYDKPKIIKPDLGPIPDLDNLQALDPLEEKLNRSSARETLALKKIAFLQTREAHGKANELFYNLLEEIDKKVTALNKIPGTHFTFYKNYEHGLVKNGEGFSVLIEWNGERNFDTHELRLKVKYVKGGVELLSHGFNFYDPSSNTLKQDSFGIDVNDHERLYWKRPSGIELFSNEQLLNEFFTWSVDMINTAREKRISRSRSRGY